MQPEAVNFCSRLQINAFSSLIKALKSPCDVKGHQVSYVPLAISAAPLMLVKFNSREASVIGVVPS